MTEKTYHLRPEGFARLRRRLVVTFVVMFCVVSLLVVGYEILFEKTTAPWSILVIVLTFILLVFVVMSVREIKRQRAKWLSFRLTAGDARVVREQSGLPTLEFGFPEITKLRETRAEGLLITGREKFNFIFVPESLEGYEEVRAALAHAGEIEQATPRAKLRIALTVICVIALVPIYPIVMQSRDARVVVPLGGALLALFVFAFVVRQRSKSVDKRLKRTSWLTLALVLAILWKISTVLSG